MALFSAPIRKRHHVIPGPAWYFKVHMGRRSSAWLTRFHFPNFGLPTETVHGVRYLNLKICGATNKHKFTLLQKQIWHLDLRLAEVMPANDDWSGSCPIVLPKPSERTRPNDESHSVSPTWNTVLLKHSESPIDDSVLRFAISAASSSIFLRTSRPPREAGTIRTDIFRKIERSR